MIAFFFSSRSTKILRVGNFLINPTVSPNRNGKFPITTFLVVVSSVAKSLSSANTLDLLIEFISVDLPTLVYPTRATLINLPLLPLWTPKNLMKLKDLNLFHMRPNCLLFRRKLRDLLRYPFKKLYSPKLKLTSSLFLPHFNSKYFKKFSSYFL